MKQLRLLFLFVMLMVTAGSYADTITLHISGTVTNQATMMPVVNNPVRVEFMNDTLHPELMFTDSAFTNPNGYYSLDLPIIYVPGTFAELFVRTVDCNNFWPNQSFPYNGTQQNYTASFVVCADSINPVLCDNFIQINSQQGLSVSLTGGLFSGSAVSYVWNMGDGTAKTGQNISHTYSQTGAHTISLQTYTADSCTDVSSVTVILSDTLSTQCEAYFGYQQLPDTLTLVFSGSTTSNYPAEFSWQFGDGSAGTGQLTEHTYTAAGLYSVSLTVTDSTGCTSTATMAVAVSDTNTTVNCQNYITINGIDQYHVSLHGAMLSGFAESYEWMFGDSLTVTGQDVEHTFPGPGMYVVTLTTEGLGCVSVSTQIIVLTDSIPMGCNSYFTAVAGSEQYQVQFEAITNNNYPTVYDWFFNDPGANGNDSSALQNPLFTFSGPGNYLVTLTTTDSTGCISVSSSTVYVSDSTTSICQNTFLVTNNSQFEVSLHGDMLIGEAQSYQWQLGDGTSATGQDVEHTYSAAGSYTITLTTEGAGCISVTSQVVAIIDSIPNGCNSYFTATALNELYQVQFTASTSNTYPTVYSWNFGDSLSGTLNSSTLQNPIHTFSGQGTFVVTLTTTDSTGCTSTFMAPVYVSGAGSNYINGQVFAGNQPVTAFEVLLYSQQPDGSFMLEQTASPDSLNIYNFSDVTSGIYLILAIPDPGTIFSAEYLPTYFGNTFMWQSASPVVLGTAQNPYNINLVPFDSIMGGSGRISGGLLAGGKSSVNADQLVLILDQNANPVRYMFTDANGSFAFTGLPFGTYQVYPIIPGLTTQSVVVTLTQTTPSAEVYMTINGQTILGIASQMKTSVIESLYPNPATDAIQVTVSEGGLYDVRIIDDAGRTVVSPYLLNLEKAVPSVVEINSLKKGIYNLVLTSDKGNRSVQRFVKH